MNANLQIDEKEVRLSALERQMADLETRILALNQQLEETLAKITIVEQRQESDYQYLKSQIATLEGD